MLHVCAATCAVMLMHMQGIAAGHHHIGHDYTGHNYKGHRYMWMQGSLPPFDVNMNMAWNDGHMVCCNHEYTIG